ncbi:MAG: hypothetical protein KatS3mg126_0159 [Lysobacteraceae bacterium]|nr:MAG: hypothetical protein KatS3mg126_0159 [Xanthomonadaceae bacterium]
MGVAGLASFAQRLIAHGRDPATPCALIENGSLPGQRVVLATLAGLPAAAARFKVVSPALLLVGEVAALGASLHWFGGPPLGRFETGAAAERERPALPSAA